MVLFAAALAVATTLLFYLTQKEHHETERLLASQQILLAAHSAANLEESLRGLQQGLSQIAGRGRTLLDEPRRAKAQLALLFREDTRHVLTGLYLRDTQGNILAEYPENGLAGSSFPVHLLAGDPAFFSSPRLLPTDGKTYLLMAEPIKAGNRRLAELGALIALPALAESALAAMQDQGDLVFLLDSSGRFLLHRNPALEGRLFTDVVDNGRNPDLFALFGSMVRGERGSRVCRLPSADSEALDPAGTATLLTYTPLRIPGERWAMALALPHRLQGTLILGRALQITVIALGLSLLAALAVLVLRWHRRTQWLFRENLSAREEYRRLGEKVQAAEARSRHLLDNAGDAILFIEPDTGGLRETNRQAEDLLGYTAAEIRALSLSVLFSGHQRRRYLRLVKKVLKDGYGEEGNLVFRRKNGQIFNGAVHARLGRLGDEEVVHVVLRDVSGIKRIENELRQKNRDLSLVNEITHHVAESRNLQGMLDAILTMVIDNFKVDGGGIYLKRDQSRNLQLAAHHNIAPEVLVDLDHIPPGIGLAGKTATSGQPRSSADIQRDRRVRSAAARKAGWRGFQSIPLTSNEKTVGVLFLYQHKKCTMGRDEVRLLMNIGKQVGASIESAGLFEALQWQYRLTRAANRELESSRRQLKENLEQLGEANRVLEGLDQMKNNFLTLASHELRTPLTYVLSSTELLSDSLQNRLSADEQRCLEAIHLGGKRLQEIVQDLIEVTRLEAQSLYIGREQIDMPALVAGIGSDFHPILKTRELKLEIGEFPQPLALHGDPDRLRKALSRLLENAIKFTPRGGRVEIRSARRTPHEILALKPVLSRFSPTFFQHRKTTPFLQITVRDTGIGIEPEEQVRIFDKFYEVGDMAGHFTSQTRFGGKGVGLGLTLVKGMVEAHGGMVWVESAGSGDHSTGSAFHLLLPLAPEQEEARHATG